MFFFSPCVLDAKVFFISQLPDGRVIKVEAERFKAPEILFQPHLIDVEGQGIAELVFNTIQVYDDQVMKIRTPE